MKSSPLIFVKLGGAAITNKSRARTALPKNIENLVQQIAKAYSEIPDMHLVLGHGSGSFGHFSGQTYDTRNGVSSPKDWLGFAEVWDDARQLNELVIHAFLDAGLPVMAFPPSTWVITQHRKPISFFEEPIRNALQHNLIPVVNGDVIFDRAIGGTILSTEEIFSLLADELHPDQIILASREPGVWQDFPTNTQLAESLTPRQYAETSASVQGSVGMDVTGGMAKKVAIMMDVLQRQPKTRITITSGLDDHSVYDALIGGPSGTLLHSE
ncbi:isopentenyl phosphate kinase [Leptolinea tardivitalis]|uniref:Isopentenyl phosphate kinase n=1 Tax=Leptolinea tardivitalis TaxID=229920 RepID=A0A0P6WYX7_9CHLR|nr:isopentenyl phosphate kinase [Leptolinea tardivitalis]KPL71916.1 hypothetical protein ADM99_10975 [Leptolinea tardivitalis]GAP20328.1 isopentenyl phosphate kinase [Leptolinea tardivitalis]